MRVAAVRKKYPEFFATVQTYVWAQLLAFKKELSATARRPLSYNAAAVATLEHYKENRRKK